MEPPPTERAGARRPPGVTTAADAGFERLRGLLLGATTDAVERLQRRLDDPETLADEVSRVLPAAIRRRNNDDQLAAALSPTIADALRAQVAKNPELVIDVVFPVLGPAIRKWIARSLEELAEAINRTVEHTFSIQGLRWRIEARRTGRPFAEVVLAHSLVYRIEQVLLVHKDTGLLLHHALLRDPVARNPDLVSSMLTAIRDFVRDSFQTADGADLHEFRVGALTVVVEEGPRAVLTAVVRGAPPPRLRAVMQEVLEAIHGEQGQALAQFGGGGPSADTARFASCEPLLERCMLEQRRAAKKSRVGSVALVAVAVAIVAALTWWWMLARAAEQRWAGLVAALRAEPGFVVTSHDRTARDHQLVGLRDPLARAPEAVIAEQGFAASDLRGAWTPVALPAMALQRARQVLAPPASIELRLRDSTLLAQGQAHSAWLGRSRALAPLIPGVDALAVGAFELSDAAVFAAALADIGAQRLTAVDGEGFDALAAALDRLDVLAHAGGLGVRVAMVGPDRPDATLPSTAERLHAALARRPWRSTEFAFALGLRRDDAVQVVTFTAELVLNPGPAR